MDCCDHCHAPDPHRGNTAYRRVLWAVLGINAAMFLIEIGAGVAAGSASLQADALDFFGDAANYAISLLVVGMVLRYRAMAALAKGTTMGLFGLWIIGTAIWHTLHGTLPSAYTMGAIVFAALAATHYRLVCFGRIATVMPICARLGFAPAMTCSEIWPFFLQRLAYLVPAQAGRILLWQPSWPASPCKGRGW
jgi:Co/Zn/Cd efflux system component